jgi:hypothetical protein
MKHGGGIKGLDEKSSGMEILMSEAFAKIKPTDPSGNIVVYECRCDERLQTKAKEFTRLAYTGLVVELEHLKIETRLIDEKFANTMGESQYVT